MKPTQTINDIIQFLSSKQGVTIMAMVHKSKLYRSRDNGKTTLGDANVTNDSKFVSVA